MSSECCWLHVTIQRLLGQVHPWSVSHDLGQTKHPQLTWLVVWQKETGSKAGNMGGLSYFRSGVGKADIHQEASGSGSGEVSGAAATGTRSQTG